MTAKKKDELLQTEIPEEPEVQIVAETESGSDVPDTPLDAEKPKRITRKKKAAEPESAPDNTTVDNEKGEAEIDDSKKENENPPPKAKRTARKKKAQTPDEPEKTLPTTEKAQLPESANALPNTKNSSEPKNKSRKENITRRAAPILTIESGDYVESQSTQEETAWHEIRNAYRTRKVLTGILGGVEHMDNGKSVVVASYNDFRIIIPLKEMMIRLNSERNHADTLLRQRQIIGNMLGAEIDFVIKGIDSNSRSIVASRKEAMLRKQNLFYLSPAPSGGYRIEEGQVVQARVIAVAEKGVRVEAFGAECSIVARDLAWEWLGDAQEHFSIGDQVLIRLNQIDRQDPAHLRIRADIKSVTKNTVRENLQKCKIQGKYVGKVTDIYKGVVYVRLNNGVNAVAHACYDRRTPGKKDDVSFVVTHIDRERSVGVGIISRIIKRNI